MSKVTMADLISCWNEDRGQPGNVMPWDKSQEFLAYTKEHLDEMVEKIEAAKPNEGEEETGELMAGQRHGEAERGRKGRFIVSNYIFNTMSIPRAFLRSFFTPWGREKS